VTDIIQCNVDVCVSANDSPMAFLHYIALDNRI